MNILRALEKHLKPMLSFIFKQPRPSARFMEQQGLNGMEQQNQASRKPVLPARTPPKRAGFNSYADDGAVGVEVSRSASASVGLCLWKGPAGLRKSSQGKRKQLDFINISGKNKRRQGLQPTAGWSRISLIRHPWTTTKIATESAQGPRTREAMVSSAAELMHVALSLSIRPQLSR